MQQFQRSPVGSFVRSPVGSRNRVGAVVPTSRIVVLGFNNTTPGGPAAEYLAHLAAIDAYVAALPPATQMKLGLLQSWSFVTGNFIEITGSPPTGTTAPIPRTQVPSTAPTEAEAVAFFHSARDGMIPTNVRFWQSVFFSGSHQGAIQDAALALNPTCGFFDQGNIDLTSWVHDYRAAVGA